MKKFVDSTNNGNEKAYKRGKRVPDGAVNLAWAKSPKLSPEKNIVVVDMSRAIEENNPSSTHSRKIMYANSLGILEDEHGNQIIDDEYPAITDVFTIDELFQDSPGYEYKPEHILPYVHVSRYFHIDYLGLTMGSGFQTYKSEEIKIVDNNGHEYVDANGNRRYRILIAPARTTLQSSAVENAYRIWAFVDANLNESLYLTYNKIEVTTGGLIKNQDINHQEILNPFPFFEYTPEESDVVDPDNRNKKIYSTKPTTLKNQVLNLPTQEADGYRVYVPKKAIEDPRQFQLFRWRVRCDFLDNYVVDPTSTKGGTVAVGVISTSNTNSISPYVFFNLWKSDYNATNMIFENPIGVGSPTTRAYWNVNFDTISQADLAKFDVLVWSPPASMDFSNYMSKINYFVNTLGKVMFIDTNDYILPTGLGITTSCAIHPITLAPRTAGTLDYVNASLFTKTTTATEFFNADDKYGGWEFGTSEYSTLSFVSTGAGETTGNGKTQCVLSIPSNWITVLEAPDMNGVKKGAIVRSTNPSNNGTLIVSTIGLAYTISSIFNYTNGSLRTWNLGDQAQTDVTDNSGQYVYYKDINGVPIEGAYKFLFNTCLMAVSHRILDNTDQKSYSSLWTYTSPWKASWVINGVFLSQYERDQHNFVESILDVSQSTVNWQRKLSGQTLKQIIDGSITAEDLRKVQGTPRAYTIEVTNGRVSVPSELGDNSFPMAWTNAYTPAFIVPLDLGPHIIRDDPIKEEYEAGQYIQYSYPPKPYGGMITAEYIGTSQIGLSQTTEWIAFGTAQRSEKLAGTTDAPPPDSSGFVEVELTWTNYGTGTTYNAGAGGGRQFDYGMPAEPNGIRLYTEDNYYSMGGGANLNWPYWGINLRLQSGSTGEQVMFWQDFINLLTFYGGAYGGPLAVDGIFGPLTANSVRIYQQKYSLKQQAGIIDAETWYSMGSQILRLGAAIGNPSTTNYQRFYYWPARWLHKRQISDAQDQTFYMKRSDMVNGPTLIWESFAVQFAQNYDIHTVTVIPYIEGATQTVWVGAIDVQTYAGVADLHGYDASKAMLQMPVYARPTNGQVYKIDFTPRNGNTIIVTIGQDGPTGWGTSRALGVREIKAYAKVSADQAAPTTTTAQTVLVQLESRGTVTVSAGQTLSVQAVPTNTLVLPGGTFSPYDTTQYSYTNIKWTEITVTNGAVYPTIDSAGLVQLKNFSAINTESTNVSSGTPFGRLNPGLCYTMNEQRVLNPTPETGFLTKSDGTTLLCTKDKKPYGFPIMPTEMGTNDTERHYTRIYIDSAGNDPSILMGFYDTNLKEFLVDKNGQASISYLEYMQRGPQNIYVAIICNYQVETKVPLPPALDAPLVPHRWAMPVYGVVTRTGPQIAIEPLPPDLGPSDVWSLPVRTGHFNRNIIIKPSSLGAISGYLWSYQGTTVSAFYRIAEADLSGWSAIYGRPNTDVTNEHPAILDDKIIQVKQSPILLMSEPTQVPTAADPVRPVFKVSTRTSALDTWTELPWTEIADYNASNGIIYLEDDLKSLDADLIRVDYTTSRPVYNFKQYNGNRLNLNPYPGHQRDLIGKAIYIYLLPAYVKDNTGSVIPESVEQRTIRFTTDPSIFNSLSPNYNPTAVELGVVYITTALDMSELILLDTRRRGGGAKDSANAEEIRRLVSESVGYWDIGYGAGMTYQKGGFVIIRLPRELKEQFPDERDILSVIERNITVGVRFKIEDLEGNEW